MAHFSHAYPDGCCIYFSFAGSADPGLAGEVGWDAACEATYDRAWRAALGAAVDAGGTLAHHHGVGRSKAPRLPAELGTGIDMVRALMQAFDPAGILNPGNLLPESARTAPPVAPSLPLPPSPQPGIGPRGPHAPIVDRESLLARIDGGVPLGTAERSLNFQGLTLDARGPLGTESLTIGEWLALGAPGARDAWLDPVDHLLAGLDVRLHDGRTLKIRPSPRRAVGPDLTALFVGARGKFGRIDRAWLRVHRLGVERPVSPPFDFERDPPPSESETALLDAFARALLGG
jgi:alkyldihydroxyacetonephosphate synthase